VACSSSFHLKLPITQHSLNQRDRIRSATAKPRRTPPQAHMASPVGSSSSTAAMAIVGDQSERPLTPLDVALSEAATQHLASPPPPPPPIDDPLVNGIKTLFDPTIKQTTEKLMQVHKSQLALSDELERLITRMSVPAAKGYLMIGRHTHMSMCRVTKLLGALRATCHTAYCSETRADIKTTCGGKW